MLYKKIRLTNYKAFDDITFSLTSKNDKAKNIAIIFGANGSGKSTILESFTTLNDLLHTKDISTTLDFFKEKLSVDHSINTDDINELSKYISRGYTSISNIYKKIKGTSETDPTSIFLEFEENGYKGSYEIRLFDKQIIYEELKYVINKNKGCYYKIDGKNLVINDKIILDKKLAYNLSDLVNQSWGVHSFISILKNELSNYNPSYIKKSINDNFIRILNCFDKFSFRICNSSNTIEGISKTNTYLLSHIDGGNIEKTTPEELKKTEKMLSIILKPFVDDLVKMKYVSNKDNYNLMLIKKINNKETKIDFSNESSGIKELVKLLPYVIKAINGENVIFDEYANHIHDVISINFLETIIPYIKGQIILSTHNSILLDQLSDQFLESFYFIKVNNSKRSINCITDIESRIRKDYNYQKKYISDNLYLKYRNNASYYIKKTELENMQCELSKVIHTNSDEIIECAGSL